MKILIISDHEKIIEKIPLVKDQFFIGRSAICDVALKKKDLKEIHFTVQKKYQPDADEPEWIIFTNIDEVEKNVEHRLNHEKKFIDVLYFEVTDDRRLQDPHQDRRNRLTKNDRRKFPSNKKSALAENLRQEEELTATSSQNLILEVIFIKISLNTVTNVIHLNGINKKWRCFATLPDLFLTVDRFNNLILKGIHPKMSFKAFVAGMDVTESLKTNAEHKFTVHDQLNLHIGDMEYIIRFVAKQKYVIKRKSLFEDSLFVVSFTAFIILLGLFMALRMLPMAPEEKPMKQTRFIRLEKLPEPELPPIELPRLEPLKAVEVTEDLDQVPMAQPSQPIPPRQQAPAPKKVKAPVAAAAPPPQKPKGSNLLDFLKNKQKQNKNGSQSLEEKTLSHQNREDLNTSHGALQTSNNMQLKAASSNDSSPQLESVSGEVNQMNIDHSNQNLGKIQQGATHFQKNGLAEMGRSSKTTGIGRGKGQQIGMSVSGSITKESILQSLRANSAAFTGCHNNALIRNPNLEGSLVFSWVITAEGRVTSIKLMAADIDDTAFKVCIEDTIKSIRFETNDGGLSTKVTNPFYFKPQTDN